MRWRHGSGRRGGSLGTRLSRALALQVFVGLALVSGAVYLMISGHLAARQRASLVRLEEFVAHLGAEARRSGDADAFEHMLEDFFVGHDDLMLELESERGTVRYGTPLPPDTIPESRRLEFRMPVPSGSADDGFDTVRARLALDVSADDTLLSRLAGTLAITSLLGAVAGSVGAAWRVKQGLAPLADLDRQLHALDASTLGTRLSGEGQPAELQPLVERFNELLSRLDTAYAQVRAFNADVAHELRTPLATLVSTTELGLRGSDDAPALRELLGSNLEELERLDNIVSSMLFLSTAERGVRATLAPVPSLASLARDVVEYHEAALEEARVTVEVEGEATVAGDVMLLRQAISNLLSNATRHATPCSTIRVTISTMGTDGVDGFRLAVANTGETIPPEQLHRLFERFFRGRPARAEPAHAGVAETDGSAGSSSPPRHGLGLSIVAAIAQMHGGSAFAESHARRTSVGIVLPPPSLSSAA